MKLKRFLALELLLLCTLAAIAVATQAVRRHVAVAREADASLTRYVPQGALVSIESPDFAALLQGWSSSSESKAWLASDNYSVFANSRLFSRLSEARDEFVKVAGLPAAGNSLLGEMAGKQSVFAWYDVGRLEFLYVTRMPSAKVGQTQLLQARGRFVRRHAGDADFFIRTGANEDGKPRTVAFAEVSTPSGDLLLLATREDLMANALELIAGNPAQQPLQQEPWFAAASAALVSDQTAEPVLHMVLNLDRLVPMPYFRSYWIQRNVLAMKAYTSAVSDLYLEPQRFREERVLLPRLAETLPTAEADVSDLAALVPPSAGVFRATSSENSAAAVAAIEEQLLGQSTMDAVPATRASDPSLDPTQAGSASDLETRIDRPVLVLESSSTLAMTQVLRAAGLNAFVTVSGAEVRSAAPGAWLPIHSAIVLRGTHPWNAATLQPALQEMLRGRLTAAALGIAFRADTTSGATVYELTGSRPLSFASRGNLLFLANEQSLLLKILDQPAAAKGSAPASTIAGFDHAGQRVPFLRLTSILDRGPATGAGSTPSFFSRNLGSLSTTFSALESERFFERTLKGTVRQTVVYQWHTP